MIATPARKETLVTVAKCLTALGHGRSSQPEIYEKLIKKYGINVVTEHAFGRGVMRFMMQSQMDELLEKHRPTSRPPEESHDDPQLHVIALENKIAEQGIKIDGLTQSVNELVRSNNFLAERLGKVLHSLGAA